MIIWSDNQGSMCWIRIFYCNSMKVQRLRLLSIAIVYYYQRCQCWSVFVEGHGSLSSAIGSNELMKPK